MRGIMNLNQAPLFIRIVFCAMLLGPLQGGCGPQLEEFCQHPNQKHSMIRGIQIHCGFSESQREVIAHDLETLMQLNLKGPSADALQSLLETSDLTPASLQTWLTKRIHTLLPPNIDSAPGPEGLVAHNYGAALFESARKTGSHQAWIPGFGTIAVDSPRIGLVQLTQSYFDSMSDIEVGPRTSRHPEEPLRRLGLLFHEARHSDGNGSDAGYPHVTCPSGHSSASKLACDATPTGAYMIQSRFLQAAAEGCTECSASEKTILSYEAFQAKRQVMPVK